MATEKKRVNKKTSDKNKPQALVIVGKQHYSKRPIDSNLKRHSSQSNNHARKVKRQKETYVKAIRDMHKPIRARSMSSVSFDQIRNWKLQDPLFVVEIKSAMADSMEWIGSEARQMLDAKDCKGKHRLDCLNFLAGLNGHLVTRTESRNLNLNQNTNTDDITKESVGMLSDSDLVDQRREISAKILLLEAKEGESKSQTVDSVGDSEIKPLVSPLEGAAKPLVSP